MPSSPSCRNAASSGKDACREAPGEHQTIRLPLPCPRRLGKPEIGKSLRCGAEGKGRLDTGYAPSCALLRSPAPSCALLREAPFLSDIAEWVG